MDDMAAAHSRDYAAKRQFDDAWRTLDELLRGDQHRLGPSERDVLRNARDLLKRRSDHIVAVWD